MSEPLLSPRGLVPLPSSDAWAIARARSGHLVEADLRRVSEPNRPFVQRLLKAPFEERDQLWNEHLQTLDGDTGDDWIEAVAAINPDDPAPEDENWGQPLSFKLPPVEPFPLSIFPAPVARLIADGAKAIGCPPDFLALPVLAVGGVSIGRSASLLLKPGYFATASVFAACIGQPGDGKSPAVNAVVKPLHRIDEQHFAAWKAEKATSEVLKNDFATKSKAAREAPLKREEDDEILDSGNEEGGAPEEESEPAMFIVPLKPLPPILKRTVIGDITTEAMDAIMESNPRGLLQILDEASALASSMNQYRGGRGSDRQWYMSVWSGQARIVDRKGNTENVPIRVPHPFLCLVGGMVPDMIGSFCDEKGRRDGFLDRFLFSYPDAVPKSCWREDGILDVVADDWSEIVKRLLARQSTVENSKTIPHVVQFSPEGKRAWAELIDAHYAEQRSVDFAQSLAGPWAKLEQYAGRLTLILHMLQLAADPQRDQSVIPDITAQTVEDAALLLSYLKSHTRRVYEAMKARHRGDEGSDDVQCILKWLFRHRPESFSVRDLTRDLTRTFSKRARALDEALSWLVQRHCIRLQAPPEKGAKAGRGRSRSMVYLVNPNLYGSQNCESQDYAPKPTLSVYNPHPPGNEAKDSQAVDGEEVGDEEIPF